MKCDFCQDTKMLILDALQVDAARKRWQWARLGPGANDCPYCVQIPLNEKMEKEYRQ